MATRPLGLPSLSPDRSRWSGRLLLFVSLVPIVYSFWVLLVVATTGDLGLRCVLGVEIKEPVPDDYSWTPGRPERGDRIIEIDGHPIAHYTDYVNSLRLLRYQSGRVVPVRWITSEGVERAAKAEVRSRPFSTYVWAILWFLQQMVIFILGARVYWKRPRDDSARLFYWLCLVTVGAYMGGVHWSEIVIEPFLIFSFVAFAVLVPVVSLHFAMVFPRINPFYASRRRVVLSALYGFALINVLAIHLSIGWTRLAGERGGDVEGAVYLLKGLAFGSIGVAVLLFVGFFACLLTSYVRAFDNRAERNQVKWVLMATLISFPFIFYLLWRAVFDPSRLGRASAAWPMYAVSLLYTVAYALSIMRYKLMQVDALFNRTKLYLSVSVAAGLVYSAVLVLGAMLIGDKLLDQHTGRSGLAAGITAITLLILSGAARDRFQKVIDRRFHREKYKFDQAMHKMKLAVGSLVDRETLGRRLLEAAEEVLRMEWGAIYLVEGPRGHFTLAASLGAEPDEKRISADHPVAVRLRQAVSIRVPHGVSLAVSSDPAADAMIALGGELAYALEAEGELRGVLVLGPKQSSLPYEDEEIAFLGALGSVATLALHAADIQQTLEMLNRELRNKVEKIAEQQRRILLLQDQLMGQSETSRHVKPPEPSALIFDQIKGSGPAVRRMLEVARKVAGSPSAVLIRGESGTGKELLAEAIHAGSSRAGRPFVKVHCAALSQSLLESELFGHVRGSFTGADRDRMGRFEQADGGTLFLDEIGDINLEVQTKLLRVLQEMSFERVGSSQPISVDVRILAATHQDLEALIRTGRFREDLYYRLNVISIRTPSLRERKDDIFELALYFLRCHADRIGRAVTRIDDDAIEALQAHDWPGNIRELENVIERAVVLADGPALTKNDLPPEVHHASSPRRRGRPPRILSALGTRGGGGPDAFAALPTSRSRLALPSPTGQLDGTDEADPDIDAYERVRLLDALEEADGNKSEAARLVGVPRSTFCSKLKKHGLL